MGSFQRGLRLPTRDERSVRERYRGGSDVTYWATPLSMPSRASTKSPYILSHSCSTTGDSTGSPSTVETISWP